jgi:hypothetical protein
MRRRHQGAVLDENCATLCANAEVLFQLTGDRKR